MLGSKVGPWYIVGTMRSEDWPTFSVRSMSGLEGIGGDVLRQGWDVRRDDLGRQRRPRRDRRGRLGQRRRGRQALQRPLRPWCGRRPALDLGLIWTRGDCRSLRLGIGTAQGVYSM